MTFFVLPSFPIHRRPESLSLKVIRLCLLCFGLFILVVGGKGKGGFSGSGCITAVCQLNERGSSGALIVCFGLHN